MVLLHRFVVVRQIIGYDVFRTAHEFHKISSARPTPHINLLLHRGQASTKRAASDWGATVLALAGGDELLEAPMRSQLLRRSQLLPTGQAQISVLHSVAHT